MNRIDAKWLERLVRIAGMLGSKHDGEIATAARMVTSELRMRGLTWRQVIERAFAAPAKEEPKAEARRRPGRSGFQQGSPYGQYQHYGAGAFGQQGFQSQQHPFGQGPAQDESQRRFSKVKDAEGNDVELWKLVRIASLHHDLLDPWERCFVETFLGFGPKCSATKRQWDSLIRILGKLINADIEIA
jgi:hypothetical protein